MINYKDSLHLPKTDFPMKAALSKREPILVAKWEHKKLYEVLRYQRQTRSQYILHDGPPYANGHLHIGHAINKILKDMIIKAKSLSGLNAPFVPGWDCHGLPIELNVERQLKSKNIAYTGKIFREACRQYAAQQIAIQREEFKRLGILADWKHPYLTMDFKVEADIIRAFGQCIAKGHIEAGLKPVHWCIACESALAELEVSYQDKRSMAIDVKFKVKEIHLNNLPGKGPIFLPIWTTTPWTLPANEAVAVGSTIEYTCLQLQKERFLLASSLYKSCLSRYGIADYQVLDTYLGQELLGITLQHPFEDRIVPLIMSEHILSEKGTGAVHIAPSHGPEDYLLGVQNQLPIRTLVDTKGCYLLTGTCFDKQPVLEADALIVNSLVDAKALLAQETFTHSYPYCWRHNLPLIFRATSQWFLRLNNPVLHQNLNQALTQVNWVPKWGQARMTAMLGDSKKIIRLDWCLSRQRHWGVPLPLFISKQTGQYHPQTLKWIEHIAQAVEKEGVDAWYTMETSTLLGDESSNYYKLTDVLDVWFDSGVTHDAILKKNAKLKWPADLYIEGTDQFRGWFQSSLITSVVLNQKAPYRTVLAHGFTVDAKGRKMSKSIGNTILLDKFIQKWGADVIRLWICSSDTSSELVVSERTLQRTADAYRRIRNTLRFLLSNLHDFDPIENKLAPNQLISLDRWLLTRVNTTQQIIQQAYDTFIFPIVYQTIHHFCLYELGSLYLSILKDRQYTMQVNSLARRSGQTAMYHTLQAMLRWLAPVLSFTAEEAWEYLPGAKAESVFLAEWYSIEVDEASDPLNPLYQEAGGCEKCWHMIIKLREKVNQAIETARNQNQIGSALEANLIIQCYPGSLLSRLLMTLEKELKFIFVTSSVQLVYSDKQLSSGEPIKITVVPTDNDQRKCARCWHHCYQVGKDKEHPTLCNRCVQNLPNAQGESRYYA